MRREGGKGEVERKWIENVFGVMMERKGRGKERGTEWEERRDCGIRKRKSEGEEGRSTEEVERKEKRRGGGKEQERKDIEERSCEKEREERRG
jgi:hypothetical protein